MIKSKADRRGGSGEGADVCGEFVCNLCGELHDNERLHKEHMRWHENEDNECDICQRRFSNRASLKGPQSIELNKWP